MAAGRQLVLAGSAPIRVASWSRSAVRRAISSSSAAIRLWTSAAWVRCTWSRV